jgi:hypothetical protein
MIELVFIVCLETAPDQCKDVHLTYAEEAISAQQCVMQGQPQIARWISENPIWMVKRWYCSPVERRLKEI